MDNDIVKNVVLIGASVGKAWDFPGLTGRLNNEKYNLKYIGIYQFDKSKAFEELFSRSEKLPDAIIIKECAAYFPGDITFDLAKGLMNNWIQLCQKKLVTPIPATIVPVTHTHNERFKTHNPFKRLVKGMLKISIKTRMERIMEYNDWIKNYAYEKNLVCLDLEAALRTSDTDRFLKEEFTMGDGLHLNAQAYTILDSILLPVLNKMEFYDNQ